MSYLLNNDNVDHVMDNHNFEFLLGLGLCQLVSYQNVIEKILTLSNSPYVHIHHINFLNESISTFSQ